MRLILLTALFLTSLARGQEPGDVSSSFPLQQVFVGEEALLNVQVIGERPTGDLTSKEASALTFRALQPDTIARRISATNIAVSSAATGVFTVPAFNIPLKNGVKSSEPFRMEVFSPEGIRWQTLTIGTRSYRIGTIVLHPSGTIYAGQSVPLTAKVLFPTDLPVGSIGYAEIEKDNIGAWRMEAPYPPNYANQQVSPRPPYALRPREVRIDGRRYQVVNYVTFAAPLGDGPVTVGPGKIQGLQVQVSSREQRPGFFSNFSRSYNLELELPAVTFSAKPLPAGAPKEFRGAVGAFTLESALDVTTELKPGDPVLVDLLVSGQGNLDTLAAPLIDAPESNWKLYPPSRNEKEGARRSNQGSVSFSQILRPLVPIKEVPSFTLAFFNPTSAKYEVLRSEPIPLTLAPASSSSGNAAPPAGLIPVAEMQDILGLIEPKPFAARQPFRLGFWWQLPFLAIVLLLAALIIRRQLPKLGRHDPAKERLQKDLQELEKKKEPTDFLRAAAQLAETNNLEEDSFLSDLLAERDQNCFQPGGTNVEVPRSRRQEILAGLRERLGLILVLSALFLAWQPQQATAFHEQAQAAWNDGNYQEALDAYLLVLKDEATPDLLYNIGNCYYRLDDPGMAAVSYRRALRLDPKHPEARQNLDFLERKMGAIPAYQKERPEWAQKLSAPLLHGLLLLMFWLFLIALLVRFVRPSSRVQRTSLLGMVATGVLALLLAALRFFHPGAGESISPPNAILVSKEATEVRTEPSAGGSVILNASPTTACRILTSRSNWSYIELPNQTRGWIESNVLEQI